MVSWRTVGVEVTALGTVAVSMPLRFLLRHEHFDPEAPHPTPVVLVHGFLGDPTNFLLLQRHLAGHGVLNFASFSYPPRVDYQRLARRLGQAIETLVVASGVPHVDVIGHSLGGLVARYLVEMDSATPIRRLVTLGAPYFANSLPPQELAIYGASDFFVPVPHPIYGPHATHVRRGGRVVIIPECGHWGLLYHHTVVVEAARFLGVTAELPGAPLALEAAS